MGKNAGTEFVDSIFEPDRQLEVTEKFMSSTKKARAVSFSSDRHVGRVYVRESERSVSSVTSSQFFSG